MERGDTKAGKGGEKMGKRDAQTGNGGEKIRTGDANMGDENRSYERLVGALGSFHREPANPDRLAGKIMSRISEEESSRELRVTIGGLLFGWTSVAWVRRSMMAASIAVVSLFVYQQFQIMTGLRELESKLSDGPATKEIRETISGNEYLTKIMIRGRITEEDSIRVSVADIEELIESYNEMQISYERVTRLLRMNPEFATRLERDYGESFSSIRSKPKI